MCSTRKESLFQQVALRLACLQNADIKVTYPIIVTGEDHRFLAQEQLREVDANSSKRFWISLVGMPRLHSHWQSWRLGKAALRQILPLSKSLASQLVLMRMM